MYDIAAVYVLSRSLWYHRHSWLLIHNNSLYKCLRPDDLNRRRCALSHHLLFQETRPVEHVHGISTRVFCGRKRYYYRFFFLRNSIDVFLHIIIVLWNTIRLVFFFSDYRKQTADRMKCTQKLLHLAVFRPLQRSYFFGQYIITTHCTSL